ncbi:MAG TPA: hypothetical protein VHN16_00660 [Streptosporangiaceae bacterium]|nr:hypothetical protein [Streptosporangiaceae bacterium]
MAIQPPPHPMRALTTYELKKYRRELEHSLKTLPEHAQVRELLQERLAEVLAEQDSRNQLHQGDGTGTTVP